MSTRELAETKAYLEKRLTQLQSELKQITSMIKMVDSALADASFKRVELPPAEPLAPVPQVETTTVTVNSQDGTHLADIQISGQKLTVTPCPGMSFNAESGPFKSFLIGRVLEPMRVKDVESSEAGRTPAASVLSYEVEQDGSNLRALLVTNYGDSRHLHELSNAIRWTIRRLHESATAAKT